MSSRNQSGGVSGGAPPLDEKLLAAQAVLTVEERMALARDADGQLFGDGANQLGPGLRAQIMAMVAHDVEVRVREALATTLAESLAAPREIILKLAQDDELVAAPVLQHSQILTDDDLIAIATSQGSMAKMGAMAQRKTVSTALCDVLIEHGDVSVAVKVVRNPGAQISEMGLARVADRHGDIRDVQSGLIDRRELPASIIERMVRTVAEDLLGQLVERHEVPLEVASQIVCEVRDRAALGLASNLSSDSLMIFIEELEERGGVTYSLLLRSLCMGNLEFIIHLIGLRCSLSIAHVRERLSRGNASDLKALWERAGLPDRLRELAAGMVGVLRESEAEAEKWENDYYRGRMIERILTLSAELGAEFSEEDVDAILDAKFGFEGKAPAGA